jgi:hypothetical protein
VRFLDDGALGGRLASATMTVEGKENSLLIKKSTIM